MSVITLSFPVSPLSPRLLVTYSPCSSENVFTVTDREAQAFNHVFSTAERMIILVARPRMDDVVVPLAYLNTMGVPHDLPPFWALRRSTLKAACQMLKKRFEDAAATLDQAGRDWDVALTRGILSG